MKGEIVIGKDKFAYVNNGKYIRILGYVHEDGTLVFTDENDGRSYFHIHIPELIDDLPVLIVDPLCLDVDYGHNYRHNGHDVVKIHLPENTTFKGLKQISTGMNSVFVPNYSEVYYPREKKLFRKDDGIYHFFAEKLNDTTCNIIAITSDVTPKKDWVWTKYNQEAASVKKLIVPACIEGCTVLEICDNSTLALPENVEEIYIEDGIEIIGKNCFSGLPYISNIYLPRSIKCIADGSFGFYECASCVKKVPVLYVHYYDAMPQLCENAFLRITDREEYDDRGDWGNVYVGTFRKTYEVVFQKIE